MPGSATGGQFTRRSSASSTGRGDIDFDVAIAVVPSVEIANAEIVK